MKKILFSILLVFLFVPVIYAAGTTGMESNPLQMVDEGIYNFDVTDMTAGNYHQGRDDFRYYTSFTASEVEWFDFWLKLPNTLNESEDSFVEIELMKGGNVIAGNKRVLPSGNESYWGVSGIITEKVTPGTYIIRITLSLPGGYYSANSASINENYKFEIEYDEWQNNSRDELEPNNTHDSATNIPLNEMVMGWKEYHDSFDFYSVQLNAGAKARVYLDEYDELKQGNWSIGRCTYSGNTPNCVEDVMNRVALDPARSQYYYEFVPSYTGRHSFYVTGNYEDTYDVYYRIGIYQSGTINKNVFEYIDEETYYNPPGTVVFRMYNPINGEHLYTTDDYEAKVIYETQGWGFEGIGWYTADSGKPVYRLYNPFLGNHLYTSDQNEINIITSTQGWLMDFNGAPVMYSNVGTEDYDVPVYRLYNQPLNGLHHLTTDLNEYNVLPNQGWAQEGISMYVDWMGNPEPTDYYYVNF